MRRAKALGIIVLSALLVAPASASAQPAERNLRIGVLDDASEGTRAAYYRVFRTRLGEFGYVERGNLVIETRHARGAVERLPVLAAEIVKLRPDVILVTSTAATRAAMQATSSIPIVFTGVADPVAGRLVASLARPGGNVTGLSIITEELGAKWIELMREIVPEGKRFAYLGDVTNTGSVMVFNQLRDRAQRLGLAVEMLDGKPSGIETSFAAIARGRFAGLIVGAPAIVFESRDRIVAFAAREKLPAVYARREYPDAGGLLSYSPDYTIVWRRTAEYIHRIAQGARPADMPVERPDTVRLVLNLKTSRTSGIAIPPSIRHRADELIE